jgi:hypothetical protein
MSPDDRRVVLATITDDGRSLVDEATAALNEAAFGLPGLTPEQAADLVGALRAVRALAGDLVTGDGSPAVLPSVRSRGHAPAYVFVSRRGSCWRGTATAR